MKSALILLIISIGMSECGIPFVYTVADPNDPSKVALLRDALMHVGKDPNGIKVISFLEKYEIIRTAYKATYFNRLLQRCFLKWHVGEVWGKQVPSMPVCDESAIGGGSKRRVIVETPPSRIVILPTFRPTWYQPIVPTAKCVICAGGRRADKKLANQQAYDGNQ